MASFTDNTQQLSSFTPYVQQQPLEMMGKVGMYKQGQYDQGIEKIQKSFDTIGGLKVLKDEHKAYLQNKLNEMGNNVRLLGAGDFSNSSLVNSTTSQIDSIANDEVIQVGVNAAAQQAKQYDIMEKAKEKGELTPENESLFKEQQDNWYNNPNLKAKYNAQYIPFFNVEKNAIEYIDKIKPGGLTSDIIFKKDANGEYEKDANGRFTLSPTMTKLKKEGRLPEAVLSAINLAFSDPRAKQQLQISGRYNYKGYSNQELGEIETQSANSLKKDAEDKIDYLNAKYASDLNNEDYKTSLKETEVYIDNIKENLKKTASVIESNPDSIRTNLYTNKKRNELLKAYSNVITTEEVLRSPAYDVIQENQKELTRIAESKRTYDYTAFNDARNFREKQDEFKISVDLTQQKIDNEKLKITNKGGKKAGSGSDVDVSIPADAYRDSPRASDFDNVNYDNTHRQQIQTDYSTSRNALIWRVLFPGELNNALYTKETNRTNSDGSRISETQAVTNLLQRAADKQNIKLETLLVNGETRINKQFSNPEARRALQRKEPITFAALDMYETSSENFKTEGALTKRIDKIMADVYSADLQNVKFKEQTVTIGNQSYSVSREDGIDLAIIAKGIQSNYSDVQKSGKLAEDRQKAKGNEKIVAIIRELADKNFIYNDSRPNRERVPEAQKHEYGAARKSQNFLDKYPKLANNYAIFKDVFTMAKTLQNETVETGLKKASNFIRDIRNVNKNVETNFYVGDKDVDNVKDAIIKGIISNYTGTTPPSGPGAQKLLSNLATLEKNGIFKNSKLLQGIEINEKGEYQGFLKNDQGDKMYLTNPESLSIGMDVNKILESPVTIAAKSLISVQGQTITGSLTDPENVKEQSATMTTKNFSTLKNTKYDVKVNFARGVGNDSNKYYPYLYINKEGREVAVPMGAGYSSLEYAVTQDLLSYITPAKLEQYLNAK